MFMLSCLVKKTSFGDYLYSKCQQVVNKWSEKWSKRGVLLGVTDTIPIHEYNHYHEIVWEAEYSEYE